MIRTNKHGEKGREVTLSTNNFSLNFKSPKTTRIYQYDLAICDVNESDKTFVPSKYVCEQIYRQLDLPPYVAYDGKKNLYSPHNRDAGLEGVKQQITINRKTYRASIQQTEGSGVCVQDILDAITRENQTVPQDAVNALNIILTHPLAFNTRYVTIKRCYLKCDQAGSDIPGGLKLWSGICTKVTPTEGFGITIRTLKTYQVMYPGGSLIDFVKKNLEMDRIPTTIAAGRIKNLSKTLKSMKVQTNHNIKPDGQHFTRKYTVQGLSLVSASKATLDNSDDTVENYFLATYGIKLKYPNLPCVKVKRHTLMPMELCDMVPNQPYYTSLNAKQQAEMIKRACAAPDEKARAIQDVKNEVITVTNNFTEKHYGFTIDPSAKSVVGRILPTPDMGSNVKHGRWRMSAVKTPKNFIVKSVQFICLSPRCQYTEDLHRNFTNCLKKRADEIGMNLVNGSQDIRLSFCRLDQLGDIINKKKPMTYYFIILDENNESYGAVKLFESSSQFTQCLKLQIVRKVCGVRNGSGSQNGSGSKNVRGSQNGRGLQNGRGHSGSQNGRPEIDLNTLENILIKMNAKLGGVNWSIDFEGLPKQIFNQPIMIVGADVTHFTRDEGKPSIAAVVATYDRDAAKYITKVKVMYPEEGKQSVEYITDMQSVMVSILKEFRNKNPDCKPARIIYYRDGVSEGQFENTVMHELEAIQNACTELEADYQPKISVVVCTKRHKQRFLTAAGGNGNRGGSTRGRGGSTRGRGGYWGGNRRGNEKYDNMEPGTVIDSGVVSPNYFNFYLCSQQAIQGTSVPCHYYVLYDDNKFTADMWQMLSFFLCHTYARCSRSVSYPAPVYYAHLACFSARSRMLSKFSGEDWHDEARPTEQEIEAFTRPDGFNHFFI